MNVLKNSYDIDHQRSLMVMDRCIESPVNECPGGNPLNPSFIQFENLQDPPPCIFLTIMLIAI